MFQQNKFLTIVVILSLSLNFYCVSYYGGKLQELYTGEFNSYQTFFFKISNYSSALMPLVVFIFIYISAYLMYAFFDIEKSKVFLTDIIIIAFIPIMLYSALYLILLMNYVESATFIEKDIRKVKLFHSLTFEDFKNIGLFFWCLFYLILIIQSKIKYKIGYFKSALVNLVPSFLVLIIKYII